MSRRVSRMCTYYMQLKPMPRDNKKVHDMTHKTDAVLSFFFFICFTFFFFFTSDY